MERLLRRKWALRSNSIGTLFMEILPRSDRERAGPLMFGECKEHWADTIQFRGRTNAAYIVCGVCGCVANILSDYDDPVPGWNVEQWDQLKVAIRSFIRSFYDMGWEIIEEVPTLEVECETQRAD